LCASLWGERKEETHEDILRGGETMEPIRWARQRIMVAEKVQFDGSRPPGLILDRQDRPERKGVDPWGKETKWFAARSLMRRRPVRIVAKKKPSAGRLPTHDRGQETERGGSDQLP